MLLSLQGNALQPTNISFLFLLIPQIREYCTRLLGALTLVLHEPEQQWIPGLSWFLP